MGQRGLKDTSLLCRKRFFDGPVHHPKWKDAMCGRNEAAVVKVLNALEYKLGTDYVRQHPIADRFVLDFAFMKEQVAIEIDGRTHDRKGMRQSDDARDRFLHLHGWVVVRISDRIFFGSGGSFYKALIREIVSERRRQYEVGRLYAVEVPDFTE